MTKVLLSKHKLRTMVDLIKRLTKNADFWMRESLKWNEQSVKDRQELEALRERFNTLLARYIQNEAKLKTLKRPIKKKK